MSRRSIGNCIFNLKLMISFPDFVRDSIFSLAVHPELLPHFKLIPYVGSAFATSRVPGTKAKNGFQFQKEEDFAWASNNKKELPQTIWFQFEKAQNVVKMAFSSNKSGAKQPRSFAIIASNECVGNSVRVVLEVKEAGFVAGRPREAKAWKLPETSETFVCWGIKVESSQDSNVAIQNILMWEPRNWE